MKTSFNKLKKRLATKEPYFYAGILSALFFSVHSYAGQLEDLDTASRSAVNIIDGPLGYASAVVATGIGVWGAIQKGSILAVVCVLMISAAFVYNLDELQARLMGG